MKVWRRKTAPGVTVEAIRLNEENVEAVALWCKGELIEETDLEHPEEKQYGINIGTPKGMARASLGMYVYKFGTHYAAAHTRVFEDLYEPVEGDSPPPESAGDTRKRLGFGEQISSVKMI